MSQNKELQILPFYDSLSKQNHLKWWAYGQVFSLGYELDTIPMFQIQKDQTGDQVTALTLVKFDTLVETDILANAVIAGLHVREFDDYDKIIYPSSIPLGITGVEVGRYYLKISFSGQTLYSEVFQMCGDVSHLIKMEYWHNSDFCYPNGHIEYTYPYKNTIYIASDIGKPSIEYKEIVQERDGYTLPIQQISYVLHKFLMVMPEYLLYAMRVIRQHDVCKIYYANYVYDVDELLMDNPKWLQNGDLAEVVFEFNTDTVVVTNARGFANVDYEATPGSCIITDYSAKALIIKDSVDYDNFQYTPSGGGSPISFINGDVVLINDTIAKRIELFDFVSPSTYTQKTLSINEVAYDENSDNYYFAPTTHTDNVTKPFIGSYSFLGSDGLVVGEAFQDVVVEVWARLSNGDEVQRGQGLSSELSAGLPFIYDANILQLQLRVSSSECSLFSESNWFTITAPTPSGIGSMVVGFDFIVT